MKLLIGVVVTALMGIGLGVASTMAELGVLPQPPDLTEAVFSPPPGGQARVEVDEPTHDFGRVYENEERSNTFVIRNVGLGDLIIKPGKPSCKCAVSKISRTIIPPGETAELRLTWKTGRRMGKYNKSVLVRTNDPDQSSVRLSVKGHVTPEFAFRPKDIWMHVPVGEKAESQAKLFIYQQPELRITGHTLTDTATAEFFDVTITPLDPQGIEKEEFAVGGFDVQVRVKPGLPVGRFRQTAILQSGTQESDPQTKRPMQIGITGEVRPGIVILGRRGWNRRTETLNIGKVDEGDEESVPMLIQLSGTHRNTTTIKVKEIVPPELRVTLGEPKPLRQGELVNISLDVEVPADMKPCNFMGGKDGVVGHIVLETSHPEHPEVKFDVRMAVVEKTDTKQTEKNTDDE